jgi:hypothetical protein
MSDDADDDAEAKYQADKKAFEKGVDEMLRCITYYSQKWLREGELRMKRDGRNPFSEQKRHIIKMFGVYLDNLAAMRDRKPLKAMPDPDVKKWAARQR